MKTFLLFLCSLSAVIIHEPCFTQGDGLSTQNLKKQLSEEDIKTKLSQGWKYYEDFENAAGCWESLADLGIAEAQAALGYVY